MAKLLVIACVVAAAGLGAAQRPSEKTYDLRREWKPAAGWKSEQTDVDTTHVSVNFTGLPQPTVNDDATSFAMVETIVSTTPDGGSDRRWAFSRATSTKNGARVPLGFDNKTVLVHAVNGQPRVFSLEGGGTLSGDDVVALNKAFSDGKDKKTLEPNGIKIFAPSAPVKVGESWSPDARALMASMDPDLASGIDYSKTTAKFTLVAVETRGVADIGTLEGTIQVALSQMGPMKLASPILMTVRVHGQACVDGTVPDMTLEMRMTMKGQTTASDVSGGAKADLNIDMAMTETRTLKTIK